LGQSIKNLGTRWADPVGHWADPQNQLLQSPPLIFCPPAISDPLHLMRRRQRQRGDWRCGSASSSISLVLHRSVPASPLSDISLPRVASCSGGIGVFLLVPVPRRRLLHRLAVWEDRPRATPTACTTPTPAATALPLPSVAPAVESCAGDTYFIGI
jgi:hypothetical protein